MDIISYSLAAKNAKTKADKTEIQMLGSVGGSRAISFNAQTISENITIPASVNAWTVGDITINDTFTVTIEDGAVWKIL